MKGRSAFCVRRQRPRLGIKKEICGYQINIQNHLIINSTSVVSLRPNLYSDRPDNSGGFQLE